MSTENPELFKDLPNTDQPDPPKMSEIDYLKNRAMMMGIKFSNNIGVDALKKKIELRMANESDPTDVNGEVITKPVEAPVETAESLRDKLYRENMKLVRVRIQNLNPAKRELPGEIFTVGNEHLGTVKKYIPYGEATDNGYHIPNILYENLKDRQFLLIRTKKTPKGEQVETSWAREFAIEVLPPLTPKEIADLAAAQAAGNKID